MLIKSVLAIDLVSLAVVAVIIFGIYRTNLRQQAVNEMVTAGEALASQIDIAVSALSGYSDFYVYSTELNHALDSYAEQPEESAHNRVCDILTDMQPSGNANLSSVFLVYGDHLFTSETGLSQGDMHMLSADWFEFFRAEEPHITITPFYPSRSGEGDDSVMCLRTFELNGEMYVLGLVCPCDVLLSNIQQLAEGMFYGFALASKEGPFFFTSGQLSNSAEIIERRALDGSFTDYDDSGYYIVNTLSSADWKVLGFISSENLDARFTPVLVSTAFMCLLFCVLTLLMTVPIAGWIVSPVRALRDAMQRASEGDMTSRADVKANNEIGQLGKLFNDMIEQISDTHQKKLEADLREQKMRYSLLSSQINAHYIYNTMSSINSLARLGRTDDIVKVNSALIRILQSNLSNKQDVPFATVREELQTVRDYWSIETIRPNNRADLICEVEQDVYDAPLLKNILQPLIENSLHHGLTDEETGQIYGEICLYISKQDECLHITVSDNGSGIDPDTLESLNAQTSDDYEPGSHIGISNIRKRLNLAFGGRAMMSVSSQECTEVSILCPLNYEYNFL